jgi:hypothetical protein
MSARPRLTDAVPNIIANYMDDRFEGEFYLGYYKAGRSEGGNVGGGESDCSKTASIPIAWGPVRPVAGARGTFSTTGSARVCA